MHNTSEISQTEKFAMKSFLHVADEYNLLQTFTDANGNQQYYDIMLLDYLAYFSNFTNADDLSQMMEKVRKESGGSKEALRDYMRVEYLHLQEKSQIQDANAFDQELHKREMQVIAELGGGPQESTLPGRYITMKQQHLKDDFRQLPFHESISQHLAAATETTKKSLETVFSGTSPEYQATNTEWQHVTTVCTGSRLIREFFDSPMTSQSKKALYALIAQYIVGGGDIHTLESHIAQCTASKDYTNLYVALYTASQRYLQTNYAQHGSFQRQVQLLRTCMEKLVNKDASLPTRCDDIMMPNIYMLPSGVAEAMMKIA